MLRRLQVHVQQNDTVRWMLIGMGTENDMHSPFFENQVHSVPCTMFMRTAAVPVTRHERAEQPAGLT